MPKTHSGIPNSGDMLPSKIIGIQFSILSPEEIRKMSVAQITSKDTYINNKPVVGGIFDPRMGVLEPGMICPTDGLNYMQTPGYFGHVELARPVYYIQYLSTIIKFLRSVCWKCSKLLISKEKYAKILQGYENDERWTKVFKLASVVRRCGDDSGDGCGCTQPDKITKEGLSTIIATWTKVEGILSEELPQLGSEQDTPSNTFVIKFTPEMVLNILKRISDEDVRFMGFNPVFSRPDWMVCQVLAIPPPAVRPSVRQDAQQRSEDDLSHIIVNIIKANNTLFEKIEKNADAHVIADWSMLLQYYVATMVDNKIPGVASVAQRSGRPLKPIKDRLSGKFGRVRGNLMGKRVDFSARSVITPDPNLPITGLGVPLQIAMNITKPVRVNDRNKNFLLGLVKNGPDVYPGAKILEKANGNNISLRYIDRSTIDIDIGDIVHRHMMDGDGVLFNRQPTLHRMSMMCHIVKVMPNSLTFRMNIAVTKPYNADFDGDEMNMHMPQNIESEIELKELAAVPYQIVAPGNNSPIIGLFQDSLLGAYRITRENITFTKKEVMNLLMGIKKINIDRFYQLFNEKEKITSFDVLTQIFPSMSLKYKTSKFGSTESMSDSPHVLEIKNGEYIRGQLDKKLLGGGSRGILHRVCNDYGNMACATFIDDIQSIITNYMLNSGYSVGIKDLIADKSTQVMINDVINSKKDEVHSLIDQVQLGIFTNNTGKSNLEEFETKVNGILNEAVSDAGKTGRKNLGDKNRFVIMVNAGSKGSDINISQMISCLGQQTVDGKRVPYGFESRTLPHFKKYDDSPRARGFVENSFIEGLTPEELFFHAMGGRVGLIDTAVKTSTTGYIQRRLIKGMEDLKVEYDMTVCNHKNKIVQFSYGDDGFDCVNVESQKLPICQMTIEEIYNYYELPDNKKEQKAVIETVYRPETLKRHKDRLNELKKRNNNVIELMVSQRMPLMKNVFENENNSNISCAVAFSSIIDNVKNNMMIQSNSTVDITVLEAYELIDHYYQKISRFHYAPPNILFELLYYYYLSPKQLVIVHRFNKAALVVLLEIIVKKYKKSLVSPGEMVGMIAAQSIGEPTTQMTLNTFHFAGVASKSNVTRGVPRVEEILMLSYNMKNPSATIYLKDDDKYERQRAQVIQNIVEHTRLKDVVRTIEIWFDPDDSNTLLEQDSEMIKDFLAYEKVIKKAAKIENEDDEVSENNDNKKSKWIIRFVIDDVTLLDKNITVDDIYFSLKNTFMDEIDCMYSDYNSKDLVFRIRLNKILSSKKKLAKPIPLDQTDEIYLLKNFQEKLLNDVVLRGVPDIGKVVLRKEPGRMVMENDEFKPKDMWVLDTIGTNLQHLLSLDYIDNTQTYSNNIVEMHKVLGIEAARASIYKEFREVIEADGSSINDHHISLLCDRMTYSYELISIFRHGINNDNIGPIAKASFEETPEMFLKAARYAELDEMRGVSANVMCGQEGYFGTSSFQVCIDTEEMIKMMRENVKPGVSLTKEEISQKQLIDEMLSGVEDPNDKCSKSRLVAQDNSQYISPMDYGVLDDDDDFEL
jgi:DNA-directed RNA polymerase II subunit RPB1